SRSQRSSAPNKHRNSENRRNRIVAKHYVSEGNTRRLLRESEDDETPKRVFFASEEAHREPAESVVYFRSGILYRSLVSIKTVCIPLLITLFLLFLNHRASIIAWLSNEIGMRRYHD